MVEYQMRTRLQRINFQGFTLLELIVVIVILGVLAALAVPTFNAVMIKTKDQRSLVELQAAAREAVAVSTISQDGDRVVTLRSWVGGDEVDAYTPGVNAGGVVTRVRSIVWLEGNTPPGQIADAALASALGAPSTQYGYYSVDVPTDGTDVGLAMMSAHNPHCVFSTFDQKSGVLSGTAVLDHSASTCTGDNASEVVAGGDPTPIDPGEMLALEAIEDHVATPLNTSLSIDVLGNDTGAGITLVSTTPALTGTVTLDGDQVNYVPGNNYAGEDTFNYTVTNGNTESTAEVHVQVGAGVECVTNSPVPALWYPDTTGSGPATGAAAECPDPTTSPEVTGPGSPDFPTIVTVGDATPPGAGGAPGSGPDPLEPNDGANFESMTSFPHSDHSYPHYVYAADKNSGGIMWIKDTGVSGVQRAGCATLGDNNSASCPAGWLLDTGTFQNPSAVLTGQGPGHGTEEAIFNFDTMFVTDDVGLWATTVDQFTGAGTADLIVPSASLRDVQINAMTGYACFDSQGSREAGDCLWLVSDYGIFEVNIGTRTVEFSGRLGDIDAATYVQPLAVNGKAQLLIGDEQGKLQRFTVTGDPVGGYTRNSAEDPSAYGVAGDKFYTVSGNGLSFNSPTPQTLEEAPPGEELTYTYTRNPDDSATVVFAGGSVNNAMDWEVYLEGASNYLALTSPASSEISFTFSADDMDYIGDGPYAFQLGYYDDSSYDYHTLYYNPSINLDADSGVTQTYTAETSLASSYTPTPLVAFSGRNTVKAFHNHGVPGQHYYSTSNGGEANCLRKVTGTQNLTLWCPQPALFHVNRSNTDAVDGGYYLVQDTPVPGATSYTLTATDGLTTHIVDVAASPLPRDHGEEYFETTPEPVEVTKNLNQVAMFEYSQLTNTFTRGTWDLDGEPRHPAASGFKIEIKTNDDWAGEATVTLDGVESDVTFTQVPGTEDGEGFMYYSVNLPMPTGDAGTYSIQIYGGGFDRDYGMEYYRQGLGTFTGTYTESDYQRIGPNDPVDLPELTPYNEWTITEVASTPNGPVSGGSIKILPCNYLPDGCGGGAS